MTVQAQEILTYRDENFSLIGAPLNSFLEKRKDIEFGMFTTAHWRGYQGHWLLKDNKLYLTQLQSANHTLKDIFKTDEPVFAEWFTGTLEFGFGDYQHDHWWGYYENYLWLNIDKGKIIDKKITKNFSNEILLEFGKYKGRKFQEVLYGKIKDNTYTTIRKFIESLLTFIAKNDFKFKVLCPHFKIEAEDIEVVKEIRSYGIEYFLTQNYIATSSKVFWENSNDDNRAERLSSLLEKILSSDFAAIFTLTKQTLETDAEIDEHSVLINPDISYLNWALKTVEFFSVSSSYLSETFKLKKLKTFKITRLNKTVFEYDPVLESEEYKFPLSIQTINQEKFEKKNKVKYDTNHNFYVPDISTAEMMSLYGFYLDENYVSDNNESEYMGDNETYDDYDNYYDTNDWLSDAAGTDDPETMNDVYWNLD